MSAYAYFMVTLSIVIGLALSSLVSRGFTLVHQRGTLAFHWVPAVWAGAILAWIVQFCYVGWVVNGFEDWSFGVFLLMLGALIVLYGAAELILPPDGEARPDMLAHFDSTGRVALGLFALPTVSPGRNPTGSCHFGGYRTSNARFSSLSACADHAHPTASRCEGSESRHTRPTDCLRPELPRER